MTDINKILVATDFSEIATTALQHARLIADKEGAELHVQYVYLEPVHVYGVSGMPIPEAPGSAIKPLIQKRVAEWSGQPDVIIADFERDYSIPLAIKRYCEEKDIDMVVIGTHGRKGVSGFFLGSVASEVVRISNIPVLVVGENQNVNDMGYRKIMVAIDFSESSMLAFKQAVNMASDYQADLLAAHVVDIGNLPPYFPDDYAKGEMGRARSELNKLLEPAMEDMKVEQMVVSGDPHKRLVEIASDSKADLIVMGTAGLRGLRRFLTGSVADRVMRSAPCPVMVIHNLDAAEDPDGA